MSDVVTFHILKKSSYVLGHCQNRSQAVSYKKKRKKKKEIVQNAT